VFVAVRCANIPWVSRPVMFHGQRIPKTVCGKMEENERNSPSNRTFRISITFLPKGYQQYLLTTAVLLAMCKASFSAGKFNCYLKCSL
jgi:hypothetical protein